MTDFTTSSRQDMTRKVSPSAASSSDQAPMVVTRLSGWIDFGESKAPTPAWIVRTRKRGN
jgi:hypothetical protein